MKAKKFVVIASLILALVSALGEALRNQEQGNKTLYPKMAPIEQYRMDRNAEIALARSAAPESISRDAEVLVLGQKNYETAVKGKNGFVCLVTRSWAAPFNNPEYWNPKTRAPLCYNPPAARSVLPHIIKKTELVLAGLSKTQVYDGLKAAFDKKELSAPAAGSMCFMMSKEAYLTDAGDHNFAHVMFELPRMESAAWGANLPGSPIFVVKWDPEPMTEFFVGAGKWSDGTAAPLN
jgi:hypothetical protein